MTPPTPPSPPTSAQNPAPGAAPTPSESRASGRVLVFIVAHEAEQHVRSLLERVPTELFNNDRVQFLVIDDASRDAGVRVAHEWFSERGVGNVMLLRNPVFQGAGGIQKLGYRLAIDAGFDFAIRLRADDAQGPPLLPQIITAWEQHAPDIVLASRAPAGRWARLITAVQNRLTGQRLRDYRADCRGYATGFLRRVPFESNANDARFDVQILLQAVYVKATVVEVDVPAYTGDAQPRVGRGGRVGGVRQAVDALASTVQFKMHQMGMLCALRYRNLEPTRYQDKTFMLYSSHAIALAEVERERPRTVLDVGCGPGFIARRCEADGVRVTGVDAYPPLPGMMTEFHRADLERDLLPVDPFDYDAVLLLDVIEHLADPEQFLVNLRNRSERLVPGRRGPLLVISTPNIAFAGIRLNLLLGRFSYAERGILDITHKRLFTRSSLIRTVTDCGYVVERVRPAAVPFQTVVGGGIGAALGKIAAGLAWVWPTMFGFQFIVTCRPLPGVRQLLAASEQHLKAPRELAAFLPPAAAAPPATAASSGQPPASVPPLPPPATN